jgi:hypothetical protein
MTKRGGQPDDHLEKMAQEAVEEARMVLPGIQALFGFQLIAIFNKSFRQLALSHQRLHFVAILLIALAIALIMTPAAYHRQVEPGTVSEFFVALASWFVALAMLPLMLGICIEVYLLGHIVLADDFLSGLVAAALLMVFAGLWFAFPYAMRSRRGAA